MSAKINELLAQVLPVLEELTKEALEEIDAATTEAEENIARHAAATRERGEVEVELAARHGEREDLPSKAYRASMDGDAALEAHLRARYRELGPEIEALAARARELQAEVSALDPRGGEHPNDPLLHAYRPAVAVARRHREELEALRSRLAKALDDAVNPVVHTHDGLYGSMEAWSTARAWDPEIRAREQQRKGEEEAAHRAMQEDEDRREQERLRERHLRLVQGKGPRFPDERAG